MAREKERERERSMTSTIDFRSLVKARDDGEARRAFLDKYNKGARYLSRGITWRQRRRQRRRCSSGRVETSKERPRTHGRQSSSWETRENFLQPRSSYVVDQGYPPSTLVSCIRESCRSHRWHDKRCFNDTTRWKLRIWVSRGILRPTCEILFRTM